MDKLKGLASKIEGKSGSSTGSSTGSSSGAGSEDYADKGLDSIEKSTGHSLSREQNEKITDEGRAFGEKETGKKVPDKFSN